MKNAATLLLLLAVGCATATAPEPLLPTPPVDQPDPKIAEMQTQMTELLERIDVLNERLETVEERAAEATVRVARTQPPVSAPPAAPAFRQPSAATGAAEPVQRALAGAQLAETYREAIILVGSGRHADAREIFEQVFASDPSGDLADNALFWIGETHYTAGDYTNAVRFYQRVVNEYPDQNKAPDALFKTALAQAKTGDLALARRTLNQVVERYPYSSTASSARAELKRIRY